MENQFLEDKAFDTAIIKRLISFLISKWLLILAAALSISLLYLILSLMGSNLLKPSKYLKSSIFIQQNDIENQDTSDEVIDDEKDFFINYMNILDRDLVSDALNSYVNDFEVDQVFPYIEVLPGEQNLNRVYDVLLGDEIYKYIKRLSLDPKNLSKISKDVVNLSKNYFTLSLNLSSSKISEDDAKLIIKSIVDQLNSVLDAHYNVSNIKISKIESDFTSGDKGNQTLKRRLFKSYQKIKQLSNSINIFDKHYATNFKSLSSGEINFKLELIKNDFATLVASQPDVLSELLGYDSLEVAKLEEEIMVISTVLEDMKQRVGTVVSSSNQDGMNSNINLGNTNFEKLLSMESDNQMTEYRSTLYARKIDLVTELSEIKNFIFYPTNPRNTSNANESFKVLENNLTELINLHNKYVDKVNDDLGQTNPLSFMGSMYINDNDKFIDKQMIRNFAIVLVIAFILNILLLVVYFSIYRSNIN